MEGGRAHGLTRLLRKLLRSGTTNITDWKGVRWRDKLEKRVSPGPVELMKDVKPGGNLTVDNLAKREKKRNYFTVYA